MSSSRSLAVYVARKVIRHARNIKNSPGDKIWCSDCKLFPENPVTGRCGHTRCTMCIERNGSCPCGALQPESLHSNILVRDILENMMSRMSRQSPLTRLGGLFSNNSLVDESELRLLPTMPPLVTSGRIRKGAQRSRLHRRQSKGNLLQMWHKDISLRRLSASPQMRYQHIRELLSTGRCREAAVHLAHIAASSEPMARMARNLLPQVITILSSACDPRRLICSLFRAVRSQSLAAIEPAVLECPICYSMLAHPITTPCGHTFCRSCINRSMQTRNKCPLCSSTLSWSHLAQTEDNEFVCAVLGNIVTNPQVVPDLIPLFSCTVAFPDIPCPLMIFNTDFRNIIREILDSGSRRFGILAVLGDCTCSNYGTIVEVRDCILFEDGKCIVSTVGISRFRVDERIMINGFQYARVSDLYNLYDIMPMTEAVISDLQLLARLIKLKVQQWLPSLNLELGSDISVCFGAFPEMNLEGEWWKNPNGPAWLWWLVAILPLKAEVQMLILSTRDLSKRLSAVSRTLDVVIKFS